MTENDGGQNTKKQKNMDGETSVEYKTMKPCTIIHLGTLYCYKISKIKKVE